MFDENAILSELKFKAIRSSGSGGQHVNKTASKVELTFNIMISEVLSEAQKALLLTNLNSRLTKDAILIMQCGESRSQFRNKAIIIKRFLELLKTGLVEEKARIPTKTPIGVKRKRLDDKRKNSEKKANRKPPQVD